MNFLGQNNSSDSLSSGGEIDGDLDVLGDVDCVNLNVSDTATISTVITEQELEVKDPLITCGVDNPSDSLNLGLLEEYNDGVDKWDGLLRSKNDKSHYLVKGAIAKPTPSQNITLLDTGKLILNQLALQINADNFASILDFENDNSQITFSNNGGVPKFITQFSGLTNTLVHSGGPILLTLNGATGEYNINPTSLSVGTGGTKYTIPVVDGSANQLLQTDGAGAVSWATVSSNNLSQSTGLFTGGALTVNGGSSLLFDIADGTGQIVTGSTVTPISWSGLTGQGGPYTGTLTYVSIGAGPTVIISPSVPTPTQRRTNIYLGILGTVDLTNVNDTLSAPVYLGNELLQLNDLAEAIGLLNVSGNILSSNSLLTVAKSLGSVYQFGSNFQTASTNPSVSVTAVIDTNAGGDFAYVYQDGSVALAQTSIIPANYDDGNGVSSPGTVANNDWSTSRVFLNDIIMVVQPGQTVYNTLSAARSNLATETFNISTGIAANGILIGYIIIRGAATDLSLAGDAMFVQAGKFGGNGGGSGGTVDLQVAFDNSSVPQITTNATHTNLTLKSHNTSSNLFDCIDSASSSVFSVSAGGVCATPQLDADTISVKDIGLKNDVGTDRWNIGHDQTTDDILIQNAVGTDVLSIEQNGSMVHSVSGLEVFGINSNGQMTLGDFAAINSTAQLSISNPSNTEVAIYESGNATSPGAIHFYKSRNTPASPTGVISGSFLGSVKGYGYEGSSFKQGCNFNFLCTQTWGASARGCSMVINTIENNTTTPVVKFVFDHDGKLGIGKSADRYELPNVRGTIGQVLRATNNSGAISWQSLTPATTTATSLAKFNTTGVLDDSNWLMSVSNDLTNIGGKLGIGTASPGSLLEIKDGATQLLDVDDSTGVTVGVDLRYATPIFEYYADGNASTTTVTVAATLYNVVFSSGSSTSGEAVNFTVDTTTNVGRITYGGSRSRKIAVTSSMSLKSNTDAVTISIQMFKNGVFIPSSETHQYLNVGTGNLINIHTQCFVTMSNTDYLELRVTSTSSGNVLTFENVNIRGVAMSNV